MYMTLLCLDVVIIMCETHDDWNWARELTNSRIMHYKTSIIICSNKYEYHSLYKFQSWLVINKHTCAQYVLLTALYILCVFVCIYFYFNNNNLIIYNNKVKRCVVCMHWKIYTPHRYMTFIAAEKAEIYIVTMSYKYQLVLFF